MDIEITFPGGKRVSAQVGDTRVDTDQPVAAGGDGSAPAPFDLFLASIGTCAGIYALGFCQARGLSTEGLRLVQHVDKDEATGLPRAFHLELTVPRDFPEKYRGALVKAVEHCKVKKTLAAMPLFVVSTTPPSTRVDLETSCAAG